ncbi:hypothetical protein, conserved [Babesia bigemina]|uniref:Prolyl 4-hydroxylase alpha subunit Fe(2+) 2OG dioxygenase domain-containing protein n=1 Tax=Babesia bigemina TaxID=5866 RepID=A0A061DES5_BABBI|nr:hypothetical protein, conserved [Babesia bigemina]CDR97790.1 hypothetical protein, conserved [Babesia bigemina]|eukprot:XP_012769976.1 hypothetical protein, conserved [Babesia bigemina]
MPKTKDGKTWQWTQAEASEFFSYARGSFDAGDRLALDKKLRCAAEDAVTQQRCPSDIQKGFKRHEGGVDRFHSHPAADDIIGECVDELWSSDEKLAAVVADALENAATTYERVKQKGINEGLKVTKEVDVQLIQTAWKQAFTMSLSKFAMLDIQKWCASRAADGGLCALSEEDYMDFTGNTIHSIVNEGLGIVAGYAAVDRSAIRRELMFMQYNGLFTKNKEVITPYRGCATLWVKAEDLSPEHHKETLKVIEKIKRVPFELCKRCKIMLQIISHVRLVLMNGTDAEIRLHEDSLNNGVMFTILYIASIDSNEDVHIGIEVSGARKDVKLETDMLIVLRSNVPYEVKPVNGTVFIVNAWVTGTK